MSTHNERCNERVQKEMRTFVEYILRPMCTFKEKGLLLGIVNSL